MEQLVGAAGAQARHGTIVARGQIDGVRCVDMLIDTGASCCFVRRSCAERMKMKLVPLAEAVTVTLADRRTTVVMHEVRVSCMRVHGSEAACTLLVMDELSNDVIIGLSWQRAAGLTIKPGSPDDLLNGQPVRSSNSKTTVTDDQWHADQPIQLSAVLRHQAAATPAAKGGTVALNAASLPELLATDNALLRQVLQRHQRVFTEVLPVKTAQQIAEAST